ncbi:MAG TPA: hypothetical protein VFR93_06730 [Candidatus Limnocylindrales bacterium]|nr:hypothetical protein [Candidatus Limnocylindrales bacterium]
MSRHRRPFGPALLALASLLVVFAAACQGAPAAPALTDPKEILTKSVASLKDVKTFHVDAELSGKVNADIAGTGGSGSGSQFDLAGTKGTLDVDTANKKVHATASIPALLNTALEAIVLPDSLYYKVTGPLGSGDTYTKVPVESAAASQVPTDPQQAISELQSALDKLPSPPTKQADAKCGNVDCYDVQIKLTEADLASLSPSAAPSGFTNGAITVDVFSQKSDLRPVKVVATMSSTEMGTATLTLGLTYDVSLNIQAPPADQVTEASGLPIPSIELPSLNP